MKLSIYSILLISLALVLLHVAITFKDWSGYREHIIKELEKTYDAKVYIGGKVEISLITPKLTIYNVYVQYNKNKEQKLSDLISAKKIEIRPSFLSLFSFSLQPKSITLLELIKKHDSKLAVTWLTVELFGRLNKAGIDIANSPIKANALSELLDFIVDGTISAKLGKKVFDIMFETGKSTFLIIEEQDLKQIIDKSQISKIINKIVSDNQDKVQEYKNGKTKLYGFFVGEVMKLTKGKASPDVVNTILSERLSS